MSADINSKNRPLKIVLVDDDKIVLQVHANILKTIGHQPFSFEQPHDAADYLKQHDENINLIITDYKMPKMTGLELIRTVAKYGQAIPALILTAYPDDVDIEQATHYNTKVLAKPVRISLLTDHIRSSQLLPLVA